MLALTPHVRVLVCIAPADFRKGIDGLASVCRDKLAGDPFSGAVFVFRNRRGTAIKILAYDGQGFWLCQKRLSKGKFRHWPTHQGAQREIVAHQLQVLLAGGDAEAARGAPAWRRIGKATDT
jgi:transposase